MATESQIPILGALQPRPPPPALPPAPASPPHPPPLPPAELPVQQQKPGPFSFPTRRPALRVTSEYDSDSKVFFHRVSCGLFDHLAKLKLSFLHNGNGEISSPLLRFNLGKRLSLAYDVEAQNTLIKASFDVGENLQIHASRDWKEQQGEVTMVANLAKPSYKVALTSPIPTGLPRATFQFPVGEVSIEEKEDDKAERILSMNGILKGQVLNGICTAQYKDTNLKMRSFDKNLKLRYSYKDEEMTFIPEILLPSNAASLTFKRRFNLLDKLRWDMRTAKQRQLQ